MLIRSDVEQLIGHDLIKPLANFKQMASLSLKLNQRQKNKSLTLGFKVVCNILTKKWVFVKKNNQLCVFSEVVRLLEALKLPPSLLFGFSRCVWWSWCW
jgi:hypothetical protein